jgi:cytochrome c oxidase assembly protein subunit 11
MVKSHRKVIVTSSIILILMFAFSFALVPLYNVLCNLAGINGKVDIRHPGTYSRYKINKDHIQERLIAVEFDVNRNRQLACEFHPTHTVLQVRPGELSFNSYYVKNLTNHEITIQAIPSISPGVVAKHLKKLECFCFNKQTLKAGEAMVLPLRFWLEPEIPDTIHRLTLSYTLFDVTKNKES